MDGCVCSLCANEFGLIQLNWWSCTEWVTQSQLNFGKHTSIHMCVHTHNGKKSGKMIVIKKNPQQKMFALPYAHVEMWCEKKKL